MHESYVGVDGDLLFVRHSAHQPDRPTVLWIHGLGESSLCFLEAFTRPEFSNFNLLAPDLLGFGRSSSAAGGDYSFAAQVSRLWRLCDVFSSRSLFVVGHSMGGDVATFMADSNRDRVAGLVNAEGDLTPEDVFVSNHAVEAARHGTFSRWLRDDFMEATVFARWAAEWPAGRRYYASLWFCRPEAFLASAQEVCKYNTAVTGTRYSATGARFAALDIPKLYCWGSKSLPASTRALLADMHIPNTGFPDSHHWMMIDSPETFYRRISAFCEEHWHRRNEV